MGCAVFLLPLVVLVRAATRRESAAVAGLLSTELGLAVTRRLTIVVKIIEYFRFTIVKFPEDK